MAFFDLHTHPSFKSSLLNDDVDLCPNPVDFVDIELRGPLGTCIEKIAGDSLDSQSSFGQIPGGSLVVVSFIAFERVYAFVRDLERIKNIGPSILPHMRDEKESYFNRMIERELSHFLRFEEKPVGDRQYKLIQQMSEYPTPSDPNTVYVIASVEGVHNFYKNPKLQQQENNPAEIVTALEQWKTDSFRHPDQFPRLFYITLAHHGQNVLTNHAWAIPVRFAHDLVTVGSFDPTGKGLSPLGKAFVKTALRQSATEKRILLDVKHLSLQARQDLYALLNADPNLADVPILATHMGVTGTSWENPSIKTVRGMEGRPKNLSVSYNPVFGFIRRVVPSLPDRLSQLTHIPFNPWSINLYNEDIAHIMRSRGLIGVSLDRRILGATLNPKSVLEPIPVEDERFSRLDFPLDWQNPLPVAVSLYPQSPLPRGFDGNVEKRVSDLWAFCQQVLHIVLITELSKGPDTDPARRVPANVNPWDHICLGSDYDGLITALKTTPSASQLSRLFHADLKSCLTSMADHLNAHLGTTIQIPANVVERLSVQNGVQFLRKHFQ